MTVVLDASAAVPLFLDDETNDILPGLVDALSEEAVTVPAHWPVELGNALLAALRRQRIDQATVTAVREMLKYSPIEIDGPALDRTFAATWRLAERHSLTLYDAAYLELAMRLDAALATNDEALIYAAQAANVRLFGR